jgi:alpha-glucosidase
MPDYLWWRDGVIYQIYPRSFADSNGDGVGDLPGIIAHLDYLNDGTPNSLGVDAIWLSPIYPSPMRDFGYDVANYHDIDPVFGTLADFDRLLAEAHKRGIRVIMDWVMNHTSDQHPWFIESRSSRDNPKRDWYIWRDPSPRRRGEVQVGRPPNNWQSVFGGPAWSWDETTGQYYLHLFLPEQPDLNWRNPQVHDAVFAEARFWLDRGVDGFRLDVADAYYKDAQLRDNPFRLGLRAYDRQQHIYDWNQPENHDLLKEFRQLLDQYPERMAVGEVGEHTAHLFYGNGSDELHLAFNFAFLRCPWSAQAFQRVIEAWDKAVGRFTVPPAAAGPPAGWPCYVLSNHDQTRHISRYAAGRFTEARARVAATMLLTLRGTPFLYYGEELGLRQVSIPRTEIMDPPGKRYWPLYKGRDGCRTPLPWNDQPNAGFTTGRPWLRVNPDYRQVNVAAENQNPDSLLNFYRRLIWLRKASPALRCGSYRPLIQRPVGCLAYLRETVGQTVLVGLNFRSRPGAILLPPGEWRVLLSNVRLAGPDTLNLEGIGAGERLRGPAATLAGNEAVILEQVR